MKLRIEIFQHYQHFLALSSYQDSNRRSEIKAFLVLKSSTSTKLPIVNLMEEIKTILFEKYDFENLFLPKLIALSAVFAPTAN